MNNPTSIESLKKTYAPIRMRNYGRIIQNMIQVAADEPNQAKREALTKYIAMCMRQKNYVWNRDQDSSMARVKEDIAKLSNGRLTTNHF